MSALNAEKGSSLPAFRSGLLMAGGELARIKWSRARSAAAAGANAWQNDASARDRAET
jgi:hypothetical protein